MDELKRVSADRDDYKKRFEAAEKATATAKEESGTMGSTAMAEKADSSSIDTPSASVKSPVSSVLGIFSPKQKPEASDNKDDSEEFFSYDDEVPRLQAEVQEKTAQVERLELKVSSLEKELVVTKEISSGLVGDLETATRELNESKEASTASATLQSKIDAQTEEISTLKDKLQSTETRIASLQADLAKEKKRSEESGNKVSTLEADINTQKNDFEENVKAKVQALKTMEGNVEKLDTEIKNLKESKASDAKRIHELEEQVESLNHQAEVAVHEPEEVARDLSTVLEATAATATGAAKKKNKKKKKGGAAAAGAPKDAPTESAENFTDSVLTTPAIDLHAEVSKLKAELADKDAQIDKLQTKRKTEEDLREEIENMQENLLNIGQEHVEAKDRIKELQAEKTTLEEKISKLESEINDYKKRCEASQKAEAELKALTVEYENLKLKSSTLQTDLGAAQQLATSRYRDLTDLREVLQKAQPELKTLRAENANLKSIKDELTSKTSDLRRLEAREKDLRADMAIFKKQAADRDNEVRTLNEKITQETNNRLRAEDQTRIAQRDMRKSEADKIQLAAASEKSAQELARVTEEAEKLRPKVRDLEDQVLKLSSECKGLRDEVELRGSQYNSAQGLLGSMRDQTAEMAMQLKEAKDQSESLEEELGEVQRLLSERSREGETMRRLLADVDDRADAKVREMRERMEAAIEERDRAEDEAATNGRRRAREVDELKTKIRDFERDLKRAIDDRDELHRSEKEWRRRRDELEGSSEKASVEVNEIRSAMGELRAALDGSEKQVRETEKQRSDLRRMLDEGNQRYEKLQKEFKALQGRQARLNDVASSPSSIESARAGAGSPAANGQGMGKTDYVYLKTILLQFLEQKDKKRQADLVRTVLGQLLHFDK